MNLPQPPTGKNKAKSDQMNKRKIVIPKIPPNWEPSDVGREFSKYGEIEDIDHRPEKNSCIILFETEEQAQKAFKEMSGMKISPSFNLTVSMFPIPP